MVKRFFQLSTLLLAIACLPALAALSAAPTDFGAKQTGIKARILAAQSVNYRVSESTLDTGTVVREYVSNQGLVFAVSWSGPRMPDLESLLGQHFATMRAENSKFPRAGRSQVRIERPDVSIVVSGHMRAFEGKAWVQKDFPAGFSVNDIQ